MKTAANEIGANWRTARCIVALRKPGLPPSNVQEYHIDGLIPASSAALVSLVETLQDLAVARGTVTIGDAKNVPEMMGVHAAVWVSSLIFGLAHLGVPMSMPALIVVGSMMLRPLGELKWDDPTEYLPAFLVNSNLAALLGLVRYLSRRQTVVWQKVKRQENVLI